MWGARGLCRGLSLHPGAFPWGVYSSLKRDLTQGSGWELLLGGRSCVWGSRIYVSPSRLFLSSWEALPWWGGYLLLAGGLFLVGSVLPISSG